MMRQPSFTYKISRLPTSCASSHCPWSNRMGRVIFLLWQLTTWLPGMTTRVYAFSSLVHPNLQRHGPMQTSRIRSWSTPSDENNYNNNNHNNDDDHNNNDDKDESSSSSESRRYRDQAEQLRQQIREMEATLGPRRNRMYDRQEDATTTMETTTTTAPTLRGKQILVAGANGRLGSMVCRYLLRNHPHTKVVAAVHTVGQGGNSPTSRGYGRLSYEVGAEDGIGSLAPAWSLTDNNDDYNDNGRGATFTYDPAVMQNYNLQNLRLVECELLDPVQCATVVQGCDAVIYCATDFNGNLPRAVASLNVAFLFRAISRPTKGRVEVEGVQNMLGALRQAQIDRKRQEQLQPQPFTNNPSPTKEQGSHRSDPLDFVLVSADTGAFADTETPYGSFYGIKQRGEDLLKEDFPSISSTVLRLARFDDNFVKEDLNVFLTHVEDDSNQSSGKQRLINRRDAARACVDALTNKDLQGKTVHVWTACR